MEDIDAIFDSCQSVSPDVREAAFLSAQEKFPHLGTRILRGFLASCSFNLDDASHRIEEHSEWRRENLPIERTEEVSKLLNSARFRWLGFNREKQGVAVFNSMRGNFADGASSGAVRSACLAYLEDVLAKIDAEPDSKFGYIQIIVNGIPPLLVAREMAPVVGGNYPGRLSKCITVLPTALQPIGQGLISFLKEGVKKRVAFASTKDQILELANLDPESWPEDLDPDSWNTDQEWWSDTRPSGEHVQYVRQCIEAGKAEQIEVKVTSKTDTNTSYEVMVEEGDIDVSVVFEVEEGVAELDTQRLTAENNMTGSVDPEWTGVIRFELDNTYSWFTRKAVTAMVITKPPSSE